MKLFGAEPITKNEVLDYTKEVTSLAIMYGGSVISKQTYEDMLLKLINTFLTLHT